MENFWYLVNILQLALAVAIRRIIPSPTTKVLEKKFPTCGSWLNVESWETAYFNNFRRNKFSQQLAPAVQPICYELSFDAPNFALIGFLDFCLHCLYFNITSPLHYALFPVPASSSCMWSSPCIFFLHCITPPYGMCALVIFFSHFDIFFSFPSH